MKKIFENFINRQKKVLKLMGITTLLFILDIFLLLVTMINNQEAINNFLVTSEISAEILPITILSIIAIGLGVFFLILVTIFVIKTLIPDMKVLKDLTMKDELDFLINIPNEIKKEVRKNGK